MAVAGITAPNAIWYAAGIIARDLVH